MQHPKRKTIHDNTNHSLLDFQQLSTGSFEKVMLENIGIAE